MKSGCLYHRISAHTEMSWWFHKRRSCQYSLASESPTVVISFYKPCIIVNCQRHPQYYHSSDIRHDSTRQIWAVIPVYKDYPGANPTHIVTDQLSYVVGRSQAAARETHRVLSRVYIDMHRAEKLPAMRSLSNYLPRERITLVGDLTTSLIYLTDVYRGSLHILSSGNNPTFG
jgi:hypothetical protein